MVVSVLSREKLFHGPDIICPFVTVCTVAFEFDRVSSHLAAHTGYVNVSLD